MRNSRLSLILALALVLAPSSLAANVTLNLGHVGAPESPQQVIGDMFAKKVAEYTNGSVEVKIFGNGTLGNEQQLQQGVQSGTIDLAIAGTFSHLVPWAGVLETPLLYSSLDQFVRAYSGQAGQDLMAQLGKDAGVKPLFVAPHGGFRYVTTKNTAVRSPDDMKGLKLRNPNVPAFNVMANAVGAIPVPLDFSELYTALDRGVVQAQHNPLGNIVGSKLYEVQGYLSMVPWGISPHIVSMSLRAWDKLSPEQQAGVLKAAQETQQDYPAVAKAEEQKQLDFLSDKITIIKPDEIDMDAFAKVFREKGMPALQKEYGDAGMRWVEAIQGVQ